MQNPKGANKPDMFKRAVVAGAEGTEGRGWT